MRNVTIAGYLRTAGFATAVSPSGPGAFYVNRSGDDDHPGVEVLRTSMHSTDNALEVAEMIIDRYLDIERERNKAKMMALLRAAEVNNQIIFAPEVDEGSGE